MLVVTKLIATNGTPATLFRTEVAGGETLPPEGAEGGGVTIGATGVGVTVVAVATAVASTNAFAR